MVLLKSGSTSCLNCQFIRTGLHCPSVYNEFISSRHESILPSRGSRWLKPGQCAWGVKTPFN